MFKVPLCIIILLCMLKEILLYYNTNIFILKANLQNKMLLKIHLLLPKLQQYRSFELTETLWIFLFLFFFCPAVLKLYF